MGDVDALEMRRKTPGDLLYVNPEWPVVYSFTDVDDDWEDYHGKGSFPSVKSAKRHANENVVNGLHYYVVDPVKDVVLHEAHPKPKRIIRRKK